MATTSESTTEVDCPLCDEYGGEPASVEAHISRKEDPAHKGEVGSSHRDKLQGDSVADEMGSGSGSKEATPTEAEEPPEPVADGESSKVSLDGLGLGDVGPGEQIDDEDGDDDLEADDGEDSGGMGTLVLFAVGAVVVWVISQTDDDGGNGGPNFV